MFGRTPSQKRKTSGLYGDGLGYPRDLTQDLARLRQLKASATANPAEPVLYGFGSFEYVDLDPLGGGDASRWGDYSEVTLAATIKSLTVDVNATDDGSVTNRAQMSGALLGLKNIAMQRKGRSQYAAVTYFDQAITKFDEAMTKIAFNWTSAKSAARQGLLYYVDARKAEKQPGATPIASSANAWKSWTKAEIVAIQTELKRIGLYAKGIDGIIGSGTTSALTSVFGGNNWMTASAAGIMQTLKTMASKQTETGGGSGGSSGGGATATGGGSGGSSGGSHTEPLIIPKDYSGSSSNKGLIIGLIAAGALGIGLIAYMRSRGRRTTVTYQPARA
jgi:hypothetical protein